MPSVRTNAIRVGAFVVVGVILIVVVLIYFGASDMFRQDTTYVTYFGRSVQGLNLDSPVKFRGVTVGKVTGMKIAPDGQLIEVKMALKDDFKMRDSLGVKMNITGITGLRYMELDLSSAEELDTAPHLTFDPPFPVIPSTPGGFEEIETALKSVYDKIMVIDTEGISREAKVFLRTGTGMMAAADSLVRRPEMVAWVDDLNNAVANLDEMIAQLKQQEFHQRLDSMLTDLQLASVQAREGTVHLNRALATLESDIERLELANRADTLFASLSETFEGTSQLVGQSQYSVSQVVSRLSITVSQMNETMEQLNSLILSLEEYPSRILYASPPERER